MHTDTVPHIKRAYITEGLRYTYHVTYLFKADSMLPPPFFGGWD